MRVFISYGDLADQVTALRLQALGAANGLNVYVPPAYTRQAGPAAGEVASIEKLREADVVIGCLSDRLS